MDIQVDVCVATMTTVFYSRAHAISSTKGRICTWNRCGYERYTRHLNTVVAAGRHKSVGWVLLHWTLLNAAAKLNSISDPRQPSRQLNLKTSDRTLFHFHMQRILIITHEQLIVITSNTEISNVEEKYISLYNCMIEVDFSRIYKYVLYY